MANTELPPPSSLPPTIFTEGLRRIPFFSRLGVKHGIVLTALVLMAMTIITAQQLRETLYEIERSAVDKGRTVAAAVAPLVLPALKRDDAIALRRYFSEITSVKDINYVQVADANGKVLVCNELKHGEMPPRPLHPGWLRHLKDGVKLDRHPVSVPWQEGAGVDVFVALVEPGGGSSMDEIEAAPHLRIGINFDDVLQKDTPRVIRRMIIFTLIVATVMVLGLLILLGYILRPLRELHLGLKAVASGDLDYQVPIFSHDEVGRLAMAFNATAARLRAAFQRIEELATRDPLTNLPNRRTFDERLMAEAARSRRYGHPFGLIVMDLDRFKTVNDQYGHLAGDEVLKGVAKVIEASVRETDLPARIGGEEFAVILPESGEREVLSVAEKLRQAVSQLDLPAKSGLPSGIRITLSAGAACSAGHLVTPESIFSAADAALYKSKGEGRNRVTMAPLAAGKTDMIPRVDGAEEPEAPPAEAADFRI